MTIEEKAKAYDEALKVLHKYDGANIMFSQDLKEEMFPELKESESDNILNCIRICLTDANEQRFKDYKTSLKDCLAWLKKQGNLVEYYEDKLDRCACDNFNKGYKKALEKQGENEDKDIETKLSHAHFEGEIEGRDKVLSNPEKYGLQKPSDKVEPKFKVGDWITNGATNPTQISSIKDGMYFTHNDTIGGDVESIDKEYHLWTIQDAKDGDVLAYKNDIVIFKENNYNPNDKSGCMFVYCSCNNFYEIGGINPTVYKPATKEQRDLLFQKMKEAGYEWDAEKKELKKIEQNHAWSEEDAMQLDAAINIVANSGHTCTSDWLKSLKDRYTWKPNNA